LLLPNNCKLELPPKQATPFFVDKLTQIALHLEKKFTLEELTPMQRFIIARDQAHFKCFFFSGDRPGDLGRVKVPEVLHFPNDDGFFFNQIWGKVLRDGDKNVFDTRRNSQVVICPIKGIEGYLAVARQLQIHLTKGYLFRPTNPKHTHLLVPRLRKLVLSCILTRWGQMMGKPFMAFVPAVQLCWR